MRNIIFTDIDGTLAIGREIPESAVRALNAVRDRGDLVFLCTGRNPSYVTKWFHDIADGFICANGRYAFMGDTVLYDHPIETAPFQRIYDTVLARDGGLLMCGVTAGYYAGSEEGGEWFLKAHPGEEMRCLTSGLPDEPIYIFDVFFPTGCVRHQLEVELCDICLFNPHGPIPTADVTVYGHDKGTAIEQVCQSLQIDRNHSYAFGDGKNDLCMFNVVGHSIAMGNAMDVLKEQAEFVTTGIHDDGIHNGLINYGLI